MYLPPMSRASILAKVLFPVPGVPVTTIIRRFVWHSLLDEDILEWPSEDDDTVPGTRLFQHSLYSSRDNQKQT
jgi:hypothetical protein